MEEYIGYYIEIFVVEFDWICCRFLFFLFLPLSSGSREWVSGRQERNLGTAAISEGVTAVLRERREEEKKNSQLSPENESNKEERRRRSGWREVEEAAVQYAAISRRVQEEARNMLGGQQQ